MNVIYIFIIIWIFIIIRVIIFAFKAADEDTTIGQSIFLSIILNIPVSMIYIILSYTLWVVIPKKEIKEYTGKYIPIVSLERDSNIKGSFILGTGSIEEIDYYYMYNNLKNNTYKLFKLPCKEYIIRETDEVLPGIRKVKITKTFWKFYLIEEENEKIINVPKGTIIKEFNP